jgi:hypothetical protein
MNSLAIIIECAILYAVFTIVVVPVTGKSPPKWLYDYPPAIRERVKSLERYNGKIPAKSATWGKKILGGGYRACAVFLRCLSKRSKDIFAGLREFVHLVVGGRVV